ncbi:hypothetical protein [Intestinimonas sp. MSJ-38]|uniref:hypothetical protein n=1 Tax=Intestinimonas sp. MSJ-38 TaxID=2841532 RepID=UPI0011C4701A|nr:hypothetical protein [Intestinimonas sp. MSJ-38]MBU5431505.1 hypothetical protein [Intestinimonas sp. MSJ-38]
MKRWSSLLCAVMMLVSICIPRTYAVNTAAPEYSRKTDPLIRTEVAKLQAQLLYQKEVLEFSSKDTALSSIYGGMYTNGGDTVYVCVVAAPNELHSVANIKTEISPLNIAETSNFDSELKSEITTHMKELPVKYIPVKYSLLQLQNVQSILENVMEQYNIRTIGYVQKTNSVDVYVESLTQQLEDEIRNYVQNRFPAYSEELLNFFEAPENNALAYFYGGDAIATNTSPLGSVGYNAFNESTRKYGFVTAGHVASIGDRVSMFTSPYTYVGTCTHSMIGGTTTTTYGTGDAAFVPFETSSGTTWYTSYVLKNQSGGSEYLQVDDIAQSYMEGNSISIFGARSGKVNGTLQMVNATESVRDEHTGGYRYYRNLLRYNAKLQPGDSGGAICYTAGGSNVLIGIVTSGLNGTRQDVIASRLRITPVTVYNNNAGAHN